MELDRQPVDEWDRQQELQVGLAGSEAFTQNSKLSRRLAFVVIQFSEESAAGSVLEKKTMTLQAFELNKVEPNCGAEVRGIDLSQPLNDDNSTI